MKIKKKSENKLTKTEIKEILWFRFGKLFIRLRDTDYNGNGYCISCGNKMTWTEGQGGHYIPNGLCKKHTWDERNVNFQCIRCNKFLHGSVHLYRDALILKIGKEKVEYFEATKHEPRQRKEWELIEMIKVYRGVVEELIDTKTPKVQKEIREYIKTNGKKKREILY